MQILKQGSPHKHKFICHHCGCEFVADETEYKCSSKSIWTGRTYYSYIDCCNKTEEETTTSFTCRCPTCGVPTEDSLTSTNLYKINDFCKSWTQD